MVPHWKTEISVYSTAQGFRFSRSASFRTGLPRVASRGGVSSKGTVRSPEQSPVVGCFSDGMVVQDFFHPQLFEFGSSFFLPLSAQHSAASNEMALRRFNAGGKKQKELTDEQKQEIKEAFDLFDTDGSG
eukprot:symbB.v1.2.028719.t1/scaffold3063.1/size64395/3